MYNLIVITVLICPPHKESKKHKVELTLFHGIVECLSLQDKPCSHCTGTGRGGTAAEHFSGQWAELLTFHRTRWASLASLASRLGYGRGSPSYPPCTAHEPCYRTSLCWLMSYRLLQYLSWLTPKPLHSTSQFTKFFHVFLSWSSWKPWETSDAQIALVPLYRCREKHGRGPSSVA